MRSNRSMNSDKLFSDLESAKRSLGIAEQHYFKIQKSVNDLLAQADPFGMRALSQWDNRGEHLND